MALALSADGFEAEPLPVDGETVAQVLSAALRQRPDIVLLGLDVGCACDDEPMIGPLVASGAAVIVLTPSTDPVRHGACLAAGAATVLSMSCSLEDVRAVVRRVGAGQPLMSGRERDEHIRRWRAYRSTMSDARRRFDTLTDGEHEVLGLLVHGCTVSEIAHIRVVAEATVRTQVKSILGKLGVSSQIAAVALAHRIEPRRSQQIHGDQARP